MVKRSPYYITPCAHDGRLYWAAYNLGKPGASHLYNFAGLVVGGESSGHALDTLAWLGTNTRP
jgi:hypothetical protein